MKAEQGSSERAWVMHSATIGLALLAVGCGGEQRREQHETTQRQESTPAPAPSRPAAPSTPQEAVTPELIARGNRLYLRQEGRGIGLAN